MRGFIANDDYQFKGQSRDTLITFGISLAFFALLNPLLHYILKKWIPEYKTWTVNKQMDWIARITSTVHAVIFTSLSFYILFVSQKVYDTVLQGSLENECPLSLPTLSISLAYFLLDIIYVIKYFKDKMTIVHHLGAGLGAFLITGYELGPIYMLSFGMTEASTPFVNMRSHLYDLGYKNSMMYALNGLAMWLCFLIFRMPLIGYIPYLIFQYHWEPIMVRGTFLMAFIVIFGYSAISILNIWWFYLITKGLLKVLSKKKVSNPVQKGLEKVQ